MKSSARRIRIWRIIRRSVRSPSGPATSLPRTMTTRKLRHAEIARAVETGVVAPKARDEMTALLQKYAPGRTITPETTLDELGLSSLDRVQLMIELEQKLGADIDERAFSRSTRLPTWPVPRQPPPSRFGSRSTTGGLIARSVRRVALPCFLLPLARIFAHIHVRGRENLESPARTRYFRVESSESPGRAGDPGQPSRTLPLSAGHGDGEGIFRRALFPAATFVLRTIREHLAVSPVDIRFQRVSNSAAGDRSRADHSLYGRAGRRRMVDSDFSRRRPQLLWANCIRFSPASE